MIIQLGKVQIIDGETYKNEVEKRENATVSLSVPRGKIFDREGNPVVDNRSLHYIYKDERCKIRRNIKNSKTTCRHN